MKVAGTTIETATDDDRSRTLIVSDLHVPLQGGDAVIGALATVCERARADARGTRLLILGDLFEMFLHVRQLEFGGWAEVNRELAATTAAGVPVTVLHGNRDFLLDRRFARATGCRVVAGGIGFRSGPRNALALHGDELCTLDVGYQRAKRILRNPVVRTVARRLPLSLALRAGGKARDRSREHLGRTAVTDLDPVAAVAAEAFAAGFDLLIFGHIHRPAHGRLDGGGEYRVLPAFDEAGIGLEAVEGEFRFTTASGDPVPDYPPGRFA